MEDEARRRTIARLRRAAGQVEGITRMIEQDRACGDVLVQIAAARAALGKAAAMLLEDHVRAMVEETVAAGDEEGRARKRAELIEVFSRYCAG